MIILAYCWADPRGNAIRGRPVDGVEQAHSTRPDKKNTGNFIGPSSRTVAEITLQRTDTTHDLSSESREAITTTDKHTHLKHKTKTSKPPTHLHKYNKHTKTQTKNTNNNQTIPNPNTTHPSQHTLAQTTTFKQTTLTIARPIQLA